MDNPFDFFDRIYCINLPECKGRKAKVSLEFEKVGILDRIQWMAAPAPPSDFVSNLYRRNPAGEFGCSLSHMLAVVQAISDGASNVLIFEDDASFVDGASDILASTTAQLPEDWSSFYLGYGLSTNQIDYIGPNLIKPATIKVAGTYAYAMNGTCFMEFIKHWSWGITRGVRKNKFSPIDVLLPHFFESQTGIHAIHPQIVRSPVGGASSIISKRG